MQAVKNHLPTILNSASSYAPFVAKECAKLVSAFVLGQGLFVLIFERFPPSKESQKGDDSVYHFTPQYKHIRMITKIAVAGTLSILMTKLTGKDFCGKFIKMLSLTIGLGVGFTSFKVEKIGDRPKRTLDPISLRIDLTKYLRPYPLVAAGTAGLVMTYSLQYLFRR